MPGVLNAVQVAFATVVPDELRDRARRTRLTCMLHAMSRHVCQGVALRLIVCLTSAPSVAMVRRSSRRVERIVLGPSFFSGWPAEDAGAEGDSRKQREEEQNEKKKNTP